MPGDRHDRSEAEAEGFGTGAGARGGRRLRGVCGLRGGGRFVARRSTGMADVGEEQSDEQMAKDYINSIMYAVPDVERMVPAHRPVKM